jgi:hypothetical protein
MGDVYEYVLGKMAASGNNGQFRTPRHIIRMMVELMKPTLKDEICDPAMGSAGFIVESAKYITDHYKSELLKKEHADHYKKGMFHGFDTDLTMMRIGAMNLMLHGVDEPDLDRRDSLSASNPDKDKYTLCLANPPFAGSIDSEDTAKSLLTITNTKKTELLFVALFVRMLQLGGRCASIVPDGVLFGNSNVKESVRKAVRKGCKACSLCHCSCNRNNLIILFCLVNNQIAEGFSKACCIKFFDSTVAGLERSHTVEYVRLVFCGTVALSFFGNYVNDNRPVKLFYALKNIFKLFFVMTVNRSCVFKAQLNKKIVCKKEAFNRPLKAENQLFKEAVKKWNMIFIQCYT